MPVTTKQIHLSYEMNNYSEEDIKDNKWYSLEEVKQMFENIYSDSDALLELLIIY